MTALSRPDKAVFVPKQGASSCHRGSSLAAPAGGGGPLLGVLRGGPEAPRNRRAAPLAPQLRAGLLACSLTCVRCPALRLHEVTPVCRRCDQAQARPSPPWLSVLSPSVPTARLQGARAGPSEPDRGPVDLCPPPGEERCGACSTLHVPHHRPWSGRRAARFGHATWNPTQSRAVRAQRAP
jgi:hypothetical protein